MKYNFDCPVCNEFRFTKPLLDEKNAIERCYICGWIFNEKELENPKKISMYKMKFLEQRKKNSKWTWLEENKPTPVPHICPICNKYEFPDDNSFDICPYCGWEDDGVQLDNPQFAGGANNLCLLEYKEKYDKRIKEDPKYHWLRELKKQKK